MRLLPERRSKSGTLAPIGRARGRNLSVCGRNASAPSGKRRKTLPFACSPGSSGNPGSATGRQRRLPMSMDQRDLEQFQRAVAASVREHWKLFLAEGIILVLLGVPARYEMAG